jgi:hypothetical protein
MIFLLKCSMNLLYWFSTNGSCVWELGLGSLLELYLLLHVCTQGHYMARKYLGLDKSFLRLPDIRIVLLSYYLFINILILSFRILSF